MARRILFDASVLFSRRHRHELIRHMHTSEPAFEALWSEWVVAELFYGLAWRWAERAPALSNAERSAMATSARSMLGHLVTRLEMVSLASAMPLESPDWLPDVNDAHLVAAARIGRADDVVLRDGPVVRAAAGVRDGVRYLDRDVFFADLARDDREELEPDEERGEHPGEAG